MTKKYVDCSTVYIQGRLYGADSPLNTCKECISYKHCTTSPGGLVIDCNFQGREKCEFFNDKQILNK